MLKQESLQILKEKMELIEKLSDKEAQRIADALLLKYDDTLKTYQKDKEWKPNISKAVTFEAIGSNCIKKNYYAA